MSSYLENGDGLMGKDDKLVQTKKDLIATKVIDVVDPDASKGGEEKLCNLIRQKDKERIDRSDSTIGF